MFRPSVQFGTGLTSNVWHLTLNFDVCINLPLLHYTAFGRLWSVVIKMRTQLLLIPTPKSHNWSALSWHNRNFRGREKFILCWWFFEGFDIVYHRALSWPRCLALCLLSCSPLLTHSHFRYLFQTKNEKQPFQGWDGWKIALHWIKDFVLGGLIFLLYTGLDSISL